MKYRTKVVEIQAVQLCWKNWSELCSFLGDVISEQNPGSTTNEYSETCGEVAPYPQINIPTLEGVMVARQGDYVIKGLKGEFYPCKPDIFRMKYESIPLPDPAP